MNEIYMYANGVGGRVFPPVNAELGIAAAVAVGVLAAIGVILTVIAIVSKKRGEKEILSKLDDIWKEKASSKELSDIRESISYADGIHGVTADYLKGLSESSKAMADLAHLSLQSVEDRLSPQNLESVVALEKSRARFAELQKTANIYTLISASLPHFSDKVFDFGNPPETLALVMFPSGVDDMELFGYGLINRERAMASRTLLLSVIYSVSFTDKHADRYTYEDLYKWFKANNAKGIKEYFEKVFIPAAVSRQKGSGIVRYRAEYIIAHVEERISLTDVASYAGVSPGYLSKSFKKVMGRSMVDYVNSLKVERAKAMMARSGGAQRVSELALALGFDNIYYFSKVFKRVTGLSPSEWLKTQDQA